MRMRGIQKIAPNPRNSTPKDAVILGQYGVSLWQGRDDNELK